MNGHDAPMRIPPHSIDGEVVTLASMVLSPTIIATVQEKLSASDFYRPVHGLLFGVFADMASQGKPIDLVTVPEELRRRGKLSGLSQAQPQTDDGGIAYLVDMVEGVPSAANWEYYAGIVRDKSTLRKLITLGNDLTRKAYEPDADAEPLLDELRQQAYELHVADDDDHSMALADAAESVLADVEAMQQKGAEANPAISTGFRDLDHVLGGGFMPGALVTLGACTSSGKTTLASNIVANVLNAGGAVLVVSGEMLPKELARRYLAAESGVFASKLKQGQNLHQEDWTELQQALGSFAAGHVHLHGRACTVGEIGLLARKLSVEWGRRLSLICVDYVQLMKPSKGARNRVQEVGGLVWGLKQLSQDLATPLLALSQINREGAKSDKPSLHSLRESGDIENHSDVVIFLASRGDATPRPDGSLEAQLRVAKNRDGMTSPWEGDGSVQLRWQPGILRFDDLPVEGATV